MGTPTFKLVFGRRRRALPITEGAIELRVTYNCVQKHSTMGVGVLPGQWRDGSVVNRLGAAAGRGGT